MVTIIYAGILTLSFAYLSYLALRKIKRYKYEWEETTRNFALAMEAGAISTWKYSINRQYFTPLMGQVVAGEGFSWDESLKILHPDDHASLQELFDALCSNRKEGGELVLRYFSPPHDDYRYYESKMSVRRNAEGTITHIIGTQHDITEKRIREMELDNARKSIELAMSAAEITAWDYDIRTSRLRTLCGDYPSKKKKVTLEDGSGWDWIHPDDREAYILFIQNLLHGSDSHINSIVIRIRRGDNTYRQSDCTISVIRNSKGVPTHLIGSLLDISQRLQLQHKLEQVNRRDELILNNINSGLAYIGSNYVVEWENMAVCSASLSYEAYKTGEKCYKSAHGRNEPCENCVMKRAFQSKQVEQIEFTFDSGKSIEVFATPVFNANNEIEGVVIRVDNITERKIMINALEQAKEKAEDSDRLKSAFLANMSHEIRTPLNAIVGFSDLLLVTDNEEEKEQYGKIIAINNELLLQLINDILDLSKMESGMLTLTPQEVDLAILFEDLGAAMRQRVKSGVEFICDNPYSSCIATLDPNRMAQVVTNFATNAIKFTTQGYIKMGYEYINDGLRLYVTDTGIGIAKDKLVKVFDRFEKLNDFAQGTGLGLSICKAIAEAHNGTIGVESTVGEGSTFWAWAPIKATIIEKDAHQPDPIVTHHHPSVHTPPPLLDTDNTELNKKSILVAEDVDSNFLLVSSILQSKYDLCHVANGAEAVETIRERPFDLVLMDMKMPLMNGIEATREIRKFNTTTPIVALTAHAFDNDRKAALEAGCNEYVVKPINRQQLFEALKKYI